MIFTDDIFKLLQGLFPTGRAWRLICDREKVYKVYAEFLAEAINRKRSVLDQLPDNPNFTEDDADTWERRLAIFTQNTDLESRKQAIARKYGSPGSSLYRQSAPFLEGQLQLSDFNVFVHENRFDDGFGNFSPMAPEDVAISATESNHGTFNHGERNHGSVSFDIIANGITPEDDANFEIVNLAQTFFIGGQTVGNFTTLPISRREEFRQLVLTIKPAQSIAFLFINFV